jgi:hypothetical protein
LRAVSKETRAVLPGILSQLPSIDADEAEVIFLDRLVPLQANECPKRTPTGKVTVRIVNDDSFNVAIALGSAKGGASGRVAVLNMASPSSPGGGWLNGAMAQEESLCYRSSLSLSLHRRYYPWKQRMGLYTADVVVIRGDMASGHRLLAPEVAAADLPVVSVISIAALRGPETRMERAPITTTALAESGVSEAGEEETITKPSQPRTVYASDAARRLTKDKMRLCLRAAARRGHGLLVLGALGCGAFGNPPEEVARCWREVLREGEFAGGWWEEVWFAVLDGRGEGNLGVFEEVLGGLVV